MGARGGFWRGLEILMVGILGVMVILVFSNVVARYLFDAAITWAEEVSRFLFVWMTFVGATLGLRRGLHIGMDMVVASLRGGMRLAAELLTGLIILLFLGVWLVGGITLVEANLDYMSPATGFSMGLVYLIGPLAAAAMGVECLARLVGSARQLGRG